MTDQQRFDALSCVNSEIKTPHLDELIRHSVHFTKARCVNPSCVPSRAAIFTGKYPSQCECPMFITKLPKSEKTFMSMLRDVGYYTAVIGKQHFAGSEIEKGYDYEDIIDGHGTFAPEKNLGSYINFLRENGVDPKTVSEDGFISGATWKADTKYHIDSYIGEQGKKWVAECAPNIEKPWFFTLSFSGPHHPYDGVGTDFEELYDEKELSMPTTSYDDLNEKPPHFKKMDGYAHIYLKDFTKEDYIKTKKSYYANMSLIDEKIGEVIAQLKADNLYDNTMIVFTSDHGDFMGDYGMVEKLQCLTDSLMRVPLFVKPPVKDYVGYKTSDNVLNIDIAATCLELAEAQIPKEMQSFTYTPYWDKQKTKKVRNGVYMEAGEIKGCVIDDIKVVHYIGRDYGEIYDLNKDPLEVKNLWSDNKYEAHKLKAYAFIMAEMYKQTPEWDTPWNIGTPEI